MNGVFDFSDRRGFMKGAAVAVAGIVFSAIPQTGTGITTVENELNIVGPRAGFAPHIGTLVSMMDWMRHTVLNSVQNLTVEQLDYLHDAKANTIGAMLLHLAAVEKFYQLNTFEGKKWESWKDKSKEEWEIPLSLGEEARRKIKGYSLNFYLNTLGETREKTLAELKRRDDN